MSTLRYLIVYPGYSSARAEEEDAFVARLRARGIDARAFGVPCEGGWLPFHELDRRHRSGDRALRESYEQLLRELEYARFVRDREQCATDDHVGTGVGMISRQDRIPSTSCGACRG